MQAQRVPPRIYNLFPRLVGEMLRWPEHARRAHGMGFDWLLLNPIHFPGFSGSCYAVKDYERVDPILLPDAHPDRHYDDNVRADGGMELLAETLQAVREAGMRPMIDLVLNHTSRDAILVREHPEWYRVDAEGNIASPSAIDPADARRVTVWGDLAQLEHSESSAREALWSFWVERVERYVDLGFEGFRCDAAYKVPAALWRRVIDAARRRNPNVLFLAETLGARAEEVDALRESGMEYLFNSSKYWAFDTTWCLEQQRDLGNCMRSVGFPESHDTPRLWAETGGNEAVQRQRFAFAAAFSSGVLMPIGYEFGFHRALHVVHTRPEDWDEERVDLTSFIRRVHEICWSVDAFLGETVTNRTPLDRATLLLERRGSDACAWIAINKDWETSQSLTLPEETRGRRLVRVCVEVAAEESAAHELQLAPAEVAYIL
jgi:starch synthase (maltosyl-transferring)